MISFFSVLYFLKFLPEAADCSGYSESMLDVLPTYAGLAFGIIPSRISSCRRIGLFDSSLDVFRICIGIVETLGFREICIDTIENIIANWKMSRLPGNNFGKKQQAGMVRHSLEKGKTA